MMFRTCLAASLLIALAVPIAARADITGAWAMSYTTKEGVKIESTLTVKLEGDQLTGTISSPRGTINLNEISAKGDDVAFVFISGPRFGDTIRIEYTGKVDGDTMTLKMRVGEREPLDVTAKRQRHP